MENFYRWNSDGANIRKGPGAGYQDLGDIRRDDVVKIEGDIIGKNWVNILDAHHSDGSPVLLADGTKVSDHFDCWMTTSYLVWVDVVPPPPPPDPQPTLPDIPYTIVLGDDVTYVKETIIGVLKPK